jgi:hypothetical protein
MRETAHATRSVAAHTTQSEPPRATLSDAARSTRRATLAPCGATTPTKAQSR